MSVKDIHNNINQTTLLAQKVINGNGTTTGVVIDTQKFMAHEFLVGSKILDGNYVLSINEADEVGDSAGTLQSMSRTVDTEPTADGNITITITAKDMYNSPKAVTVAILDADDTDGVATKIRAALTADADVSRFFDISGTGSVVTLTAKIADENDSTYTFAFTDTGTTGADLAAQVDVAGVKPSALVSGSAVSADDILKTTANLTLTVTDTGKTVRFGYIGTKRYIELVITSTSVTLGAIFNAIMVQGLPNFMATPDSKS